MKEKENSQAAARLRKVREAAGLTQEKFAEILGISVSAYKKIECGDNHISVQCLRNLRKAMNVSADYIIYGDTKDMDDVWYSVLNCSEPDKFRLLYRLFHYFINVKSGVFPINCDWSESQEEIIGFFSGLQCDRED